MKALEKPDRKPGSLRLVEKPIPTPGAGEVLLRVAAAGICGTDIHIVDGDFPYEPPVTLGHEFSGTVIRLGDGVDEGWLGARVASEVFHFTCGECPACRAGRLNMCPYKLPLGTKRDGGFASHVITRERNLHRIPDKLSLEAAALTEPLACVCNSMLDPAAVSPGDRVLILGPGAIGLLAAQVARASGGDVLLAGTPRDDERLAIARSLGLSTALVSDTEALDTFGGTWGPDVVVECSGSENGMRVALERVRRMGRHIQIGHAGRPVTVPLDLISYKELLVRGGQGAGPQSWTRAVALLRTGAIELAPLITARWRLEDWEQLFAAIRAGVGIKHLLIPEDPT